MNKLCLTALLIVCCSTLTPAQSDDHPRPEFFAGYSVLKTNYEVEHNGPFMPTVVAFFGKQTFNGFNVSATGYLSQHFGITGDFAAHFKSHSLPDPLGGNIVTKTRIFNALGGPQFKFRNSSPVSPYVRAMAGIAHTRSTLTAQSLSLTDTASSTDFALAIGGGVDVRVSDRLDLRVFQVDYNPIFLSRRNELGFGKSRADNVRFSFGVVFK